MKYFQSFSVLLVLNATCGVWANNSKNNEQPHDMMIDDTMWEQTFGRVGQMLKDDFLAKEKRRFLQVDGPVFDKPDRYCGQIINTATVEQLQQAATSFINTIFPPETAAQLNGAAMAAIIPSVQYGLRARVVCSSCRDIRKFYRRHRFVRDKGNDGFRTYCGRRRFGRRVYHSSLLLEPIDPATGEPVVGILKQYLYMKPLNTAQQGTPTESWPSDVDSFNSETALIDHFDAFLPMIIGSTGVVTIAPDYFGYGQTYYLPKMTLIKRTYQQVAVVSYLKSKLIVEYYGNTVFSNELSASGFSEGGYAVVAATNALARLGLKILNVNAGGGPFRIGRQFTWTVETVDSGNSSILLNATVPFTASSYSSLNPDLPNSFAGQDLLSLEWQQPNTYARNVHAWIASDQSLTTLSQLLPQNPLEIVNEAFIVRVRADIQQGILDPCENPVKGVDDLICQAINENTIIDQVEATTFPIVICHSPDDDAISILNQPNVSNNELLSTASVLGTTATGTHFESQFFCFVSTILEYTSFGSPNLDLNSILPRK